MASTRDAVSRSFSVKERRKVTRLAANTELQL
jgi:hypothetical protein